MPEPKYELYHHGVKGMKWGIRRYQNADGSLTKLGRVRQGAKNLANKTSEKIKSKVAAKAENRRIDKLMKKPIRKLSEAELKERYERANKEKQLVDIENNIKNSTKKTDSLLKKLGSKAINDVMIPSLVDAGKTALTNKLKSNLLDSLGLKNDFKVNKPEEKDAFTKEKEFWADVSRLATNKRVVRKYAEDYPDDKDFGVFGFGKKDTGSTSTSSSKAKANTDGVVTEEPIKKNNKEKRIAVTYDIR